MTSSLSRSRSRRAPSHIAVRVAHAVLGGLVAVGWLVLPLAWAGADDAATVARSADVTAPDVAAPDNAATDDAATDDAATDDGTTTGDLVPPLVAVGAAGALAAYAYTRRRRRAMTRTTPGGDDPGLIPLHELDRQARKLLVDIDDCVRTGAEELRLAAARSAADAVEPYAYALTYAEAELAAAFRLRQHFDESGEGEGDGRGALEEIVARCRDAGRRLDAAAPGFDQLRALERNAAAALESAGTRFRELAARTPAAEVTLADLHERYAPAASLPVAGDVEQAKDRLAFTTLHLNQARQYADRGDSAKAAAHLRAAEGAVEQATALVNGVHRLAAELASAATALPVALAAVEAVLDTARGRPPTGGTGDTDGHRPDADRFPDPAVPDAGPDSGADTHTDTDTDTDTGAGTGTGTEAGAGTHAGARSGSHEGAADPVGAAAGSRSGPDSGELVGRFGRTEALLSGARHAMAAGPYDPLDVLRRVVEAGAALPEGGGGDVPGGRAHALLPARCALAGAADFIGTHRGAVGGEARTRLAEAERLLGPGATALSGVWRADELAREARRLAERDVRAYGNPAGGRGGAGAGGAVLGGILLGDGEGPVSYGGPHTRGRRAASFT
ncbi:hypothetical protein [Streptomyces sp. NPDC060027]|uniref:hypothetical protein n=1 Tax=Streptomyces sp. NPDC060027 TaxID=3347040 RepID=UPI0036C8A336